MGGDRRRHNTRKQCAEQQAIDRLPEKAGVGKMVSVWAGETRSIFGSVLVARSLIRVRDQFPDVRVDIPQKNALRERDKKQKENQQ